MVLTGSFDTDRETFGNTIMELRWIATSMW